jgi:hypothetical protein
MIIAEVKKFYRVNLLQSVYSTFIKTSLQSICNYSQKQKLVLTAWMR